MMTDKNSQDNNPDSIILDLMAEVDRLKSGRWTPEEVNDLCHNLHGTVSAAEFADGCTAEQRKLYGCAPDRDEKLRLQKLADLAHIALTETGHVMGCRFSGCNCGQVERLKNARQDFYRAKNAGPKNPVPENSDAEKSKPENPAQNFSFDNGV